MNQEVKGKIHCRHCKILVCHQHLFTWPCLIDCSSCSLCSLALFNCSNGLLLPLNCLSPFIWFHYLISDFEKIVTCWQKKELITWYITMAATIIEPARFLLIQRPANSKSIYNYFLRQRDWQLHTILPLF